MQINSIHVNTDTPSDHIKWTEADILLFCKIANEANWDTACHVALYIFMVHNDPQGKFLEYNLEKKFAQKIEH